MPLGEFQEPVQWQGIVAAASHAASPASLTIGRGERAQ